MHEIGLLEARLRIANFSCFTTKESLVSLANVQPTRLLSHTRFEFRFHTNFTDCTQGVRGAKISYTNYLYCLINLRIFKMQNIGFSITGVDDTLLQRLTNSHNRIVVTVLDRPYIMISIMSKVGWEEYTLWTL